MVAECTSSCSAIASSTQHAGSPPCA
jgi:hypothetical protein